MDLVAVMVYVIIVFMRPMTGLMLTQLSSPRAHFSPSRVRAPEVNDPQTVAKSGGNFGKQTYPSFKIQLAVFWFPCVINFAQCLTFGLRKRSLDQNFPAKTKFLSLCSSLV
jgi:hypothetical protein